MVRFERQQNPVLNVLIPASLAAVFVVDLLTPLGVAEWVFYLVPVALCLRLWRPSAPLLIAAVSTLLILAGMFLSPDLAHGVSPWIPRANRSMATAAIWVVAVLARQFILAKLELRERDWVRSGQAGLSARMQGEQQVSQLGEGILSFLCQYLDAPVAAFYAAEEGGSLRLCASYAPGATVRPPEVLAPGGTLVGQAVAEKRLLRVDDLPADYLPISSALGKARPAHLVIVPAIADGAAHGALEFGFLHPVGIADMDLLQAVAEPVAIALRSAHLRARQAQLLEETQRQAEALQTQQEELRVSNEELAEQSRALTDSQARLEAQQTELEQINAQLEEQAAELQRQRDDLARAQVALVERADELARANQYKSEFLANMSHELRTPLNSALILAKLLSENREGNLTEEQVRFATTIHSAGNDLLALISDILDLSRIEAGRVEIHPEPVSVPAVLRALERTFRPLAVQKNLALDLSADPDFPEAIQTDNLRFQQILRNLLSNAVKFTDEGRVGLRASRSGPDRVRISVQDTGVGIEKANQELVFEAFRQGSVGTHRKAAGTGLGLTISRELARRLGGTLTLQSEPGKGSVFELELPLHLDESVAAEPPLDAASARPAPRRGPVARPATPAAPEPAAQPPAAPEPPAVEDDRAQARPGQRVILIVEDDLAFAGILRDLVRESRFQALVATTAREGLLLAERFVPSAVLLDINLPDQSGLSLLDRLKRNPATRHIPVHVVSVADSTQQALELGAIGYALKPVKREELHRAIEKLEKKLAQRVHRILVVEDAPAQREGIEALLRREGVEIVPVGTGGEALEHLRRDSFDCMVLDLSLPDMSGYELLEEMAAGVAFSFPPVIVYTGRSLSRDEELRLRRFASSVIIKGARSPERLLDEVTLFLHMVEADLPPEQQRILRGVRQREAAFEGRNLLVVEDDARNIFALASILEPKGARLTIARNGQEALEALERAAADPKDSIDLVLMDVMMPVMDGLAATREIRKRPQFKKLPILALTAKAMPDDRQKCLEAGANDYIPKPLDVDKLVSLIKVWMPK